MSNSVFKCMNYQRFCGLQKRQYTAILYQTYVSFNIDDLLKYCTLCLAIAIQGCVQRMIKRRDNNYILNLAWVEIHVRCILCRLLFYNNCSKVIYCCNNQYVASVCLTWFATQQSRWQIVNKQRSLTASTTDACLAYNYVLTG